MIRQTGGSAVAATSTRSSPWLRANCTASRVLIDRKSTRLNSSHDQISYAVFCLKKKKKKPITVGASRLRSLLPGPVPTRLTDLSSKSHYYNITQHRLCNASKVASNRYEYTR